MKKKIALILTLFVLAMFAGGCEGDVATTDTVPGNEIEVADLSNEFNPIVTIEMFSGEIIKVELYPSVAPETVNNFIYLINRGFYDGLIFHRVIPGFMIQGGDPQGSGIGGPGYSIKGEFSSNGVTNSLKHTTGVISMARSQDKNSGGSQFFIMVADAPHLDGDYAGFGKVIEGIEVAQKIVNVSRDYNDKPITKQIMRVVTVETFGIEYPAPTKL